MEGIKYLIKRILIQEPEDDDDDDEGTGPPQVRWTYIDRFRGN